MQINSAMSAIDVYLPFMILYKSGLSTRIQTNMCTVYSEVLIYFDKSLGNGISLTDTD